MLLIGAFQGNHGGGVRVKGTKRGHTAISSSTTDIIPLQDTHVAILLDADLGIDVLHKISESSWWEWEQGSSLIFWRWPKNFQQQAKTGFQA